MAASLTTVLTETTNGSTITYLYGLGLVAQSSGELTEYHLTDALGSVRQLADPSGSILLSQTFDAYGNLYQRSPISGADPSSFGWTGQQSDPNGLTYLRARYYQPSMGRFTQIDPFGGALALPASMNGYGYAHGSPTMYTDPSGEFVLATFLGILALGIIGGAIAGGGFEIGYQLVTEGKVYSWEMVGVRAAEGAILGGLTGLAVGLAAASVPASVLGATAFAPFGHTITVGAAGTFAANVAIGAAWDASVHGDPLGRAIAVNLIGEVIGEGLGKVGGKALSRVLRGTNADRAFAQLAKGAEADAIIARRLANLDEFSGAGSIPRGSLSDIVAASTLGVSDDVIVYRAQARESTDIVTGGAFKRARKHGRDLLYANRERQRFLRRVYSSDPSVRLNALQDAQGGAKNSPVISTSFNLEATIREGVGNILARGRDAELLIIRGPRSAGLDFEEAIAALGGRTKPRRFKDAEMFEFGIPDLFIPPVGSSHSGFSIIDRLIFPARQ